MEIKRLKTLYIIMSAILLILFTINNILITLDKNLTESISEAKILNNQLREVKENIKEVLSVSNQVREESLSFAKENILGFIDKLSENYNIELKEGLKIDEENQIVSVPIKISTELIKKKQLEEVLNYSENENPFFIVKSLEINFSPEKGYNLELEVEVKNGFTKNK